MPIHIIFMFLFENKVTMKQKLVHNFLVQLSTDVNVTYLLKPTPDRTFFVLDRVQIEP